MILVKGIAAAAIASLVLLFGGVMLLVPTISAANGAGVEAAAGVLAVDPSEEAIADIPAVLLPIYIDAASQCAGLSWTVIAGIGKVESNHGRYGGATIDDAGNVRPRIIGIPLNGTNGTAVIRDTDNGRLDNDTIWDRAVGPFQFIPSSWAIFGVDGNNDGIADPNNMYDAVPAAVRHLCPNGEVTDLEAAIFSYNRSHDYVRLVLEWSTTYTGAVSAIPIAGYAAPINGLTQTQAIRPHHDYPAFDVGVAVGTPTFAMVDGTVTAAIAANERFDGTDSRCGNTIIIEGVDTVRYTYCHLVTVDVTTGQAVVAGQQVGRTGGQPGALGAGNTTGPHLHLSMRGGGRALCPQPVILAILLGTPINPLAAPSSGCITGESTTNWGTWLQSRAATPIEQQPTEGGTQ